jgi:hypothetical protein
MQLTSVYMHACRREACRKLKLRCNASIYVAPKSWLCPDAALVPQHRALLWGPTVCGWAGLVIGQPGGLPEDFATRDPSPVRYLQCDFHSSSHGRGQRAKLGVSMLVSRMCALHKRRCVQVLYVVTTVMGVDSIQLRPVVNCHKLLYGTCDRGTTVPLNASCHTACSADARKWASCLVRTRVSCCPEQ